MTGYRTRVDPRRIRRLREGSPGEGPVIYWMSRDQRVRDNWALLYAQDVALAANRPLEVVFCLSRDFMEAPIRHYDFMLRGLTETAAELSILNVSFRIPLGEPGKTLPLYAKKRDTAVLVTDFSPLRHQKGWIESVYESLSCPIDQVDGHNVVPAWETSNKREYAARTIRPKLHRKFQEFLTAFPEMKRHPYGDRETDRVPPTEELRLDGSVLPVKEAVPGSAAGELRLKSFIDRGLSSYDRDRNDPNLDGTSGLSPYIHFGQISAQTVVREAFLANLPGSDAFVEEAMVRRELAENFCLYEPLYDRYEALPEWGKKALDHHRSDERPWLYGLPELEEAGTHDELWNAAQLSLLRKGRIHGYLRMYWGKMLLLWSPSPEEAFSRALYLNDRYALDGRDPNGYTGVAWCIGGLHDRPWPKRPVFGSVRSMALTGCARKFDVKRYITSFVP
ncbi:deoxyribodipyrimidine photo-lyase [Dethiosulfovibrio sp. F2B]|uniref:deoxyribodipyrimidine photo-lyase n=1 Tax=Dethiosulfovibrio faecalis TaxID=2720018 RepID=UPI001F1F2773|nr:deoxyribodipyrimidine photo-lyase [Dethiosulfovibrio faecalis]MCF4151835.1 deoxyribodipyrimidine photo-lyase [Dethiosulfovibrio faecalis]